MNVLKTLRERKAEIRKRNKEKKGKMIIFRKKQIVAASLVALIGVAGYLNWSFNEETVDESVAVMYNEASKKLGEAQMVTTDGENSSSEDGEAEKKAVSSNNYFAKAKIDREIKRDEAVEMLESVLNSTESSIEAKTQAENEIFAIAQFTQNEVGAENLIKARGFTDVIVYMTDEGVNVAVETDGLTENEAAIITDAVVSAAAVDGADIKIVEIAPQG